MSIFSGLTNYGGAKWGVESTRSISAAEKKEIDGAEVVSSEYGLSMCFTMKSGGKKYLPVSRDSQLAEGDVVAINSIQFIELGREGDNNIFRADGESK